MKGNIQVDTNHDDRVVSVYVNGELHFEWNDDANIDAPEDLTWHRDLSSIFWAGVEAGKKCASGT